MDHGREQGKWHPAGSDAAVLKALFRKGMLTAHAERLVDQALRELGAAGDWTADRVKDWIEQEKGRIGQRNQFDEVSALAGALTWAVKHPNPNPSNPAEQFNWGEPVHMQNPDPEDYGQRVGFQSQEVSLSIASAGGTSPAPNEFQNTDFHLAPTADSQDGFDKQTNTPPSPSQTYPVSRGLDPSSVMGADQTYPRGTSELVASDSSVYKRFIVEGGGFGGLGVQFGASPENTEVDHTHAPYKKLDADAQMLLDSFAAYDRMNTNENTLTTAIGVGGTPSPGRGSRAAQNDQLAGLLEAVTSAVGQEAAQRQVRGKMNTPAINIRPRRTTRSTRASAQGPQTDQDCPASSGKRKRTHRAKPAKKDKSQQRQAGLAVADTPPITNRRRKRSTTGASQDGTSAHDGEINAEAVSICSSLEVRQLPPRSAILDARAVGVHSAVALFRQPLSSGKKYTRPPMSKLFSSLELSPENFLHLQAAAKGFMLDKNHPERQSCVGSRGQSDTDMVKLRLYNCVKDFLEVEGNGEKFFGKNVIPEGSEKGFVWPDQQHKIITLVTPLLRRMVTNERQRRYAIETRKVGSNKRKLSETEAPVRNRSSGLSDIGSSIEPDEAVFQPINESPDSVFVNRGTDEETRPGIADLSLISGPSREDWNVLVAAVREHFGYYHLGYTGGKGCSSQCIDEFFHSIFVKQMGYLEKNNWSKVGSISVNAGAKQSNAHETMRDLFSAVVRNMEDENSQENTQIEQPARKKCKIAPVRAFECNRSSNGKRRGSSQHTLVLSPAISSHEVGTQTLTPPESSDRLFDATITIPSSSNVKLQIHIIHNSQHTQPPFYFDSNNYPDYGSFRRAALGAAFPGRVFKIQILLRTGLVSVGSDKDFAEALRGVRETIWMDGETKVVIELDGQ